ATTYFPGTIPDLNFPPPTWVLNLNRPSPSLVAWLARRPSPEPMSGEKRTVAPSTGVPLSVTVPVTSIVAGPPFVPPQPDSAIKHSVAKITRRGADILVCRIPISDRQECLPHLEACIRNDLPIGASPQHLIQRVLD